MTFETDDNVDTGATQNTAAEVETGQTETEQTHQQPEGGEQNTELSDEEKAKQEAEKEGEKKRNRAQERIQQLARERAEYKRELEELKAKQSTPQITTAPQIEDFEDYSEFQKAQQEYYVKQAEDRVLAKLQQDKTQQTQVEKQAAFESALIEASTELPDFDRVVQGGLARDLPMPISLDELAAEFGYDAKTQTRLLYELAKDESFHELVSESSKLKAARLLSEKVDSFSKTPAAPRTSKAPPPINPVKANAPASRDMQTMSDSEAVAHLKTLKKGK
jgi:hypothetical protein